MSLNDFRFGRGRSNSHISRNDGIDNTDSMISDQNDAYFASQSEAPLSSTMPRWNSVQPSSISNVKTPARSFYHRAFHGSLG